MPLKVYDTEDAIPQDEREDYAEDGGKWRHKVEIEAATEKRKRAQLLTEKRDADQKRKDAEDKLAEAEREHKKEKPWFYAGSGASGSGASGSGGSGGTTTTETPPAPARTEQHRNTVASAL
jgi:hypothetical protein